MTRNGQDIKTAVRIDGLEKKLGDFTLGPINLELPMGFVTALIGENGAGKSTLLEAIGGLRCSDKKINWLEEYNDVDEGNAREDIGWCAPMRYFSADWNLKNIEKALPLAFERFSLEKFSSICSDFGIDEKSRKERSKRLKLYSDGNRARVAIASVLARKTRLLVLDEPDATLDPVMRDTLNSKFRDYINEGNGDTSILFATHNIADMANVVDYAVFIEGGKVIKQGFVEDLREEYLYVHGPKEQGEKLHDKMEYYYTDSSHFEGLMKKEADMQDDNLLPVSVSAELPTLEQLSLMILRNSH